jgi:hypothetical protein
LPSPWPHAITAPVAIFRPNNLSIFQSTLIP